MLFLDRFIYSNTKNMRHIKLYCVYKMENIKIIYYKYYKIL